MKVLYFTKLNFCLIFYSLFLTNTLSSFAQENKSIYILGNEFEAQNASKNNKLIVFFKEGSTLNSKPDEIPAGKYITGINLFFKNGIKNKFKTFFPTEVQIYFQKDSLNKTSWCKIFKDGKVYSIPDPILIASRENAEIPNKSYHPRELGIRHNIIQITRDFNIKKFVDSRDGKEYKVLTYTFENGTKKTWMIENLNFKNKFAIAYNNSESLRKEYGLLYKIINERGHLVDPCPLGWGLPTLTDWKNLINKFGGKEIVGNRLKSHVFMNKTINEEDDGSLPETANNYSGMNILPAGYFVKDKRNEKFSGITWSAQFWTKTRFYYPNEGVLYPDIYTFIDLNSFYNDVNFQPNRGDEVYNSCRCVKNQSL